MSRQTIALVAVLLFASCGQSLAQFGGARRGGADSPGGGRSRQGATAERPEATRMSAGDQMRMQLASAGLALKLTPDQNALWQAYEDRVLDLLSDLSRNANAPAGENALQQIERKVDTVRNRLAAMEDLSDAAKKLYAALSDAQKEMADRMLPGTVPALYSGVAATPRGEGRPPGERAR